MIRLYMIHQFFSIIYLIVMKNRKITNAQVLHTRSSKDEIETWKFHIMHDNLGLKKNYAKKTDLQTISFIKLASGSESGRRIR